VKRPGFHLLAKPTGPICNLDCTYCFYLEKERLYPGTAVWAMPDDVLESFVRQYITTQDIPVISFAWQGGEPTLLGLDFYRKAVAFQQKYAGGRRIENAFQTNGVLLDDEWGAFLAEHDFLVGLSIDGPGPLHNRYRVNRGGGPTLRDVLRGRDALRRHNVRFNTITVVHRENASVPLDVYRFLRDEGSGYMQFIPIVERVSPAAGAAGDLLALGLPGTAGSGAVTPWSVEAEAFGAFLCGIFDEWVRTDVGRVFVQIFDVALESWYAGDASLCIFAQHCGRALAVEHNGDLYSCDHYVFPPYKLGNILRTPIHEMVERPQQREFGAAKASMLPTYCLECDVRFACNGECPKNRFIRTPNGEPGLNYLCAGYQRFFRHIDPYMRFMAQALRRERPPANVMAWTRARDAAQAPSPVAPNDPCPCGSGKKHRKCCGRSA